ncbi:MAG: hypothetical protein RLZZ40_1034 [Actinomycetota bacterium]
MKFNKSKITSIVAASAASVALSVAPAFATVVNPGEAVTINSTGGTNASDGLKTIVGFGEVQIFLENSAQLYSLESVPTADGGEMSNYPVIKFDGLDDIGSSNSWESFTSESNLTDSGRSGSVVNHLTYGSGASEVKVDYTIDYTYPNNYFNVTMALVSAGSDYDGLGHKFYWWTDAALAGSDSGFQFGGPTPAGQVVGGVYSEAGDQIEAYRQVEGNNLHWFSGYYTCPDTAGDECVDGEDSAGDWVGNFADFPDAFFDSGDSTLDNGFGISSPVSTNATESISFDLIFAKCLDGSPALQCADAATGQDSLAKTGVDATPLGLGALALVAAGGIAFAVRRRQA